jgi:predicted dehydrogenase
VATTQFPAGLDNGKEIVEAWYASVRPDKKYKGCAVFADPRELLEKQKGLDAVKIMTPDHLHGVLAMGRNQKRKACANAQASF